MSDNPDKVKATQRVVELVGQILEPSSMPYNPEPHSPRGTWADLHKAWKELRALDTPPDPAVVAAEGAIANSTSRTVVLRLPNGNSRAFDLTSEGYLDSVKGYLVEWLATWLRTFAADAARKAYEDAARVAVSNRCAIECSASVMEAVDNVRQSMARAIRARATEATR